MVRGGGPGPAEVAELLRDWQERGLLSAVQADRIREAEGIDGRTAAVRPASLLAEGLGYAGGALVVVAAVLIGGQYWTGIGALGRLAVVLVATALLLGVGAAAPVGSADPRRATGRRLRAVSWLLAVLAAAGALGVLADELLDLRGDHTLVLVAVGAAALAAVLWRRSRTPAQHAAFVAAATAAAAAAAALLPGGAGHAPGVAVWGCGVVWLLLGWGGVVAGRATADVCGAAAAGIGALLTVDAAAGSALAAVTAAGLVVAGVLARDLVLLGAGAAVTLVAVPIVLGRWFPDLLSAALALLVAGAVLVLLGLRTARRRADDPPPAPAGAPRTRLAVGAAAAVAAGTLVAVLVVGLS